MLFTTAYELHIKKDITYYNLSAIGIALYFSHLAADCKWFHFEILKTTVELKQIKYPC